MPPIKSVTADAYRHYQRQQLLMSSAQPSTASSLLSQHQLLDLYDRHQTAAQQQHAQQRRNVLSASQGHHEQNWMLMYDRLVHYKINYGDCNNTYYYKDDAQLINWVNNQRRRKQTLPPNRVHLLNSIGFAWSLSPSSPPAKASSISLQQTVSPSFTSQRQSRGEQCSSSPTGGKQKEDKSLNSNNNRRRNNKSPWDTMYEKLVEYKLIYGNCNVPRSYDTNLKLAKWVNHQRTLHNKGNLNDERTSKLNAIGFTFRINPPTKSWFEMFTRLLQYKQKYGNCLVPQRYKDDPQLGKWVNTQRTFYTNGLLSNERITILKSIDFVFCKASSGWDDMYKRLLAYKEQYGHLNVPSDYKEDKQLSGWISRQRLQYKKGTLEQSREDRLNSIEFIWSARENCGRHSNHKLSSPSRKTVIAPPRRQVTSDDTATLVVKNKNKNNDDDKVVTDDDNDGESSVTSSPETVSSVSDDDDDAAEALLLIQGSPAKQP